jgi:hypothetical protein
VKLPVWSRAFPEGVGNYRRRRYLETGKGFVLERRTRRLRSSLPVYRNRINPATGRPRRDDGEVYRRRDAAFARLREHGTIPQRERRPAPSAAWEHGPDACRSAPARRRSR